jgi:hypothetical protein
MWEPRKPPLPLGKFVTRRLPPPEYDIDGVWAKGASGIVAGRPKSAKSTVAVELAVSLAAGTPFLGVKEFTSRGGASVTLVHAENSENRVERDLCATLEDRRLGATLPVQEEQISDEGERALVVSGYEFELLWHVDQEPDLQLLSRPGMDLMQDAHLDWVIEHGAERDYLLLDPAYLLAAFDPNSTGETRAFLDRLVRLQAEAECAVIITHQESEKGSGHGAERLIGSTFLHGWYEAAIFTRRHADNMFEFHFDNLREISKERRVYAQGLGVGRWQYAASAQDATDKQGRAAPKKAKREVNVARLRSLRAEHGAAWTEKQYAEALGVSERTIRNYLAELAQPAKAARRA